MLCPILLAFLLACNKPALSQKLIPMEVICDPDSKRCLPLSSNPQETSGTLEENSEAREVNTWYPMPRWKVLFGAAKNSGRGFVANFNKPNPGGAGGYAHANDFTLFQALEGSPGSGIRLRRLTDARSTGTLGPGAEMKVSLKKDEEGDGNLFLFATQLDGNVISDAGSLKNNSVMEKRKQNTAHRDGGGIDGSKTNLKIPDLDVGSEDVNLNLTKVDETITPPIHINEVLNYLNSNANSSLLRESDHTYDYKNTTDKYLELNVFNGSDGVRTTENGTKFEPYYLDKDGISVLPSIAGTTRLDTLEGTQFYKGYNGTRNSDIKQLLDNLILYSISSSDKNYSSSKKPINLYLNFNFRFRRAVCTTSACKILNKILDSLDYNKNRSDNSSLNNKRNRYRVSNKSRETLLLNISKGADLRQASLLYEHPNRLPQGKESPEHDKPDQYVIDSVEMAKMYRNERTYSRKQEFIAHGISDNVSVVSGSWKSHQIDALVPDTATVPPVQLNEVPRKNDSVSRYATPRSLKSELQIFEEDSFDKDSGALRMETEVGDQLKNDIKEEVSGEQYIHTPTRSSPILLSEHNIDLNIKGTPSIENKSEIKQGVHYINALEKASNENMSLRTSDRQNFKPEQSYGYSRNIQDRLPSFPTVRYRISSNEILIMPKNQLKKSEELNYESKSEDLKNERPYLNLRHSPKEIVMTSTSGNTSQLSEYLASSTGFGRKRREIETASVKFKNLSEREALQLKAINPEFLKAIEFLISQSPPHVKPLTQENDSSRDTRDSGLDTNTNPIYSKPNTLHPVNSEWRSYAKSEITHSEPNSDLTEVRKSAQPYFPGVHGEYSPIFRNAPYTSKDTKYNTESSREWRIFGRAADANARTIFASYTPKSEEDQNVDSSQTFTRPKHVLSTLRNLMKSNGHKEKWSQSIPSFIKNKTNDTQKPEVIWYIILPIEKDTSWPHYVPNLPIEKNNRWSHYVPIEKNNRWPHYVPIQKSNTWTHHVPNLPIEKSNEWPHHVPNLPIEKSNRWPHHVPNLPIEKSNRWPHHVPNLPIEKSNRWPHYVPIFPEVKGTRWPRYLPTLPTRKATSWFHYLPTRKGTRYPHYVPSLLPKGKVKPSERELESERPEDDIDDHIRSNIPVSTKPLNTNVSKIMPRIVDLSNKPNLSSQGSLREMKSLSMNISMDNMKQELPDDQWIYITPITEASNETNVTMNPNEMRTTKNSTLNVTTQKSFRKLTTERWNQETTTNTTIQIITMNTNQNVTNEPITVATPTRPITVLTTKSKSIYPTKPTTVLTTTWKSISTAKPTGAVTSNEPNISLTSTESIISTTTDKYNTKASTKIPERIINKPWSMQIPWDCCDQWFVPSKWRNKNTTPMMMGMMGGD